MAANPTPAYDPMTPSVQDYQAAQKDYQRTFEHGLYVRGQTNDPKTLNEAHEATAAAAKKMNDIKAKLPKDKK